MPSGFAERRESAPAYGKLQRFWPELTASLIWCFGLLAVWNLSLSPDVAWQLWVGRHMNAGVPLYEWIVETNPPLWFWMAQPVSFIAEALQLSPNKTLIAAVWSLIGLSLLLSGALIRDWSNRDRASMLGSVLIAMFILAMSDFGQREHEALIAIIPYALLIMRRADGHAVSWPLALAIGIFVAPMIALKHYFALLPIALEIWLLVRRRKFRPFRPETLCLAAGAVIYAGAIIAFAPRYLTDFVPVLSVAYGDLRLPISSLFINRMSAALLVSSFYFWHFRKALPDITQVMLLVAGAFALSFYLQSKGFGYHIDPVIAALVIALLTHFLLRTKVVTASGKAALVLTGCILVVLLFPVLASGPYRNENESRVKDVLAAFGPGASIAPLLVKTPLLWPMVANGEVKLPLRHYHFWMLSAVAAREARGETLPPVLADHVQKVRQQTVDDMLCNPPDFILEDTKAVTGVEFDMIGFFSKEPRFEALFEAYRPYGSLGQFDIYERIAALPPPDGLTCMNIGIGLKGPQ